MKKILFDDTELEYDIFQSKNKKFVNISIVLTRILFLFMEGLWLMQTFH